MRDHRYCGGGHADHAFASFGGTQRDGLCLVSRRNMMKAGLAGIAGLTLPDLIRHRAHAATIGESVSSHRSVILLWMTGGPSHIDTWDMKPDRPLVNRGPFQPIRTAIPGEFICEHLPQQAAMLDKFTIIRSVDCRKSNHEPNQVMQTGHRESAPRESKGRPIPGDRFGCGQVSRRESSAGATLCGLSKVAFAYRIRWIPGSAAQPIYGQSSFKTSRLRLDRKGHWQVVGCKHVQTATGSEFRADPATTWTAR